MLTDAKAWEVLRQVPDPEMPVVSVCELGIVREVHAGVEGVKVVRHAHLLGLPGNGDDRERPFAKRC